MSSQADLTRAVEVLAVAFDRRFPAYDRAAKTGGVVGDVKYTSTTLSKRDALARKIQRLNVEFGELDLKVQREATRTTKKKKRKL